MESEGKLYPIACPICSIKTNYAYNIDDGKEKSLWYKCPCGTIFQKNIPDHDVYTNEYAEGLIDVKLGDLVNIHSARTYVTLIEELVYGRKMLDIGFGVTHTMDFFKNRGWIPFGIDILEKYKGRENITTDNFETYEKFDDYYDLIWLSHVLQHFKNPIEALQKVYYLLPEDGVIYIATPDINFIYKSGIPGWGHFKKREHYVMWNEMALCRELKRIGFDIVMKRRNFSKRFTAYYDLHIIAQKRFF